MIKIAVQMIGAILCFIVLKTLLNDDIDEASAMVCSVMLILSILLLAADVINAFLEA